MDAIKEVHEEINKILKMEELKWRQRAKRNWFASGDRNTQFFHAWANQRRRSNFIGSITDSAGHTWSTTEAIGEAFKGYFQELFTTEGVEGLEECAEAITARVSPKLNEMLAADFCVDEVDQSLAQMHPLKSPGPDGFEACFFQHHWEIIGDKVGVVVLNFLNGGSLDPSVNKTFIALIPKSHNASLVSEYRPISLCNVVYKLIAKTLANRLKLVLPSIISQNQSAFVPGCLITDNVLIAYEALHTMHTRMNGKKGYMAVKLDMRKAYDRMEWPFLEAMMRTLGFEEKWISLVMRCVTSVSYSVLVNGVPFGKILPSRGIRQGDPMSPYLFLNVAEGLSSLISQAAVGNRLSRVPISARGYKLSHLFFADDSLLFCRASMEEWENLFQVLNLYEKASRQQLNAVKTFVFFSKNTSPEFRTFISTSMGISATSSFDKYLGLPAMIGRSKLRTFHGICSRVQKKLDGWKVKFLS